MLSDRALYRLGRDEDLATFLAEYKAECLDGLGRLDLATPEDQAQALEIARQAQLIDRIVAELSDRSESARLRMEEIKL